MVKGSILVLLQFLLIALIGIFGDISSPRYRLLGIAIGIVLGLWAIVSMRLKVSVLPEPTKVTDIVAKGPYRTIRHPMYTAVLLATLFCVSNVASALLWLVLSAVLIVKLRYEENLLIAKFPDYPEYARHTKRIIPFLI
jgi:protein-S-isoprenylcysteine O-methyltransferase Ste14